MQSANFAANFRRIIDFLCSERPPDEIRQSLDKQPETPSRQVYSSPSLAVVTVAAKLLSTTSISD